MAIVFVDPYYLSWRANQFNLKTKFIKLAGQINDNRPKEVANNLIIALKKKIKIKDKILILGISYKKILMIFVIHHLYKFVNI